MTSLVLTTMLLAAAASAGSMPPGGDEIRPAFANTIVSTYPDGRISKLWLDEDGTFSAEGRRHEHQGGRWTIKKHQVCLTQTKPVPIPFLSFCAPIPAAGMTSGWSGKAVTGEPVTIKLTSGR